MNYINIEHDYSGQLYDETLYMYHLFCEQSFPQEVKILDVNKAELEKTLEKINAFLDEGNIIKLNIRIKDINRVFGRA